MGNISKLVLLEEDGSPFVARPVLFEAKNSIPVLWFALFSPDESCAFSLPLYDGSVFSYTGLCTRLDIAQKRLASRMPVLQEWLPGELHHYLVEFQGAVESQKAPLIGLNPNEVALIGEPEHLGQLCEWLCECAGTFDNPQADKLTILFDVTGLDFDTRAGRVVGWIPGFVEYALRGYR